MGLVEVGNKLVDFQLTYVKTEHLRGTDRDKLVEPIERKLKGYKSALENSINREVIVVVDYDDVGTGYILKMYAYLRDFNM